MSLSVLSTEKTANAIRDYLDSLWWLMHHSYIGANRTCSLTNYVDDSGSDDLSPMTALGGPVMSREAFLEFGPKWEDLLRRYGVRSPFKFRNRNSLGLYPEMQVALYRDMAELINAYKLYSVSVCVDGATYDKMLPLDVKQQLIGPYGIAFFCTVLGNDSFAMNSLLYAGARIAYLVDEGFPYSDQLLEVHRLIKKVREDKKMNCYVGAMAFDTDDQVPALQAADLIAGASRLREMGQLTDQLAPLSLLLSPRESHAHISLPAGGIGMFATAVNGWKRSGILPKGTLPSLEDMLH